MDEVCVEAANLETFEVSNLDALLKTDISMTVEEQNPEIEEREQVFQNLEDFINRAAEKPHNNILKNYQENKGKWKVMMGNESLQILKQCNDHELSILSFATIKGVTANELSFRFWDPVHILQWSDTINQMPILEKHPRQSAFIAHQITNKMTFAAQRDAVLWSHRHSYPQERSWVVTTETIKHPKSPNPAPGVIRMKYRLVFICQDIGPRDTKLRSELACRVTYLVFLDPGSIITRPFHSFISALKSRELLRSLPKYALMEVNDQPVEY